MLCTRSTSTRPLQMEFFRPQFEKALLAPSTCNQMPVCVLALVQNRETAGWTKPVNQLKRRLSKSTTQTSLQNGDAIEAEERTPSLLVVRRAEQRLALAQKLLRRRAPRMVFRKRNGVDRHAPTCAVQADLDA